MQAWGFQQRFFLWIFHIFKEQLFLSNTYIGCFWLQQSIEDISSSKFQGQHAAQFNRYENLSPATKTEMHRRFFNGILRNFRGTSFENNFWGLLLKRKQRRRRTRSDPCGFRFSLFQGSYLFIKPWSNVLSLQILA